MSVERAEGCPLPTVHIVAVSGVRGQSQNQQTGSIWVEIHVAASIWTQLLKSLDLIPLDAGR